MSSLAFRGSHNSPLGASVPVGGMSIELKMAGYMMSGFELNGPAAVLLGTTSTGFDVSWDPPTGPYTDSITQYEILYWDKDEECAFITSAGFLSSPARIKCLVPGHRYLVAPITWNAAGGEFPKIVSSVMVGRGTPPPSSGLEIYANYPTTVELTWAASPNAAGYRLWSHNVNKPDNISQAQNNTVEMTCSDQYPLFPGTWNYDWCVSAYNGNAEFAKGKCVLDPSPRPSPAQKRCPPPPEWCPAGSGPKFPGGGGGGSEDSTPTGPDGPVPTNSSRPLAYQHQWLVQRP
ncbi:hypothetical protein H112_08588 [Trichophyton rubrum D6]|uniref:Fibronectin type-III domain-containing protein n=3 Tax=Trichophyton TaxID=5550 RepID=F2SFA4_TRIRC|nr:uncharacterized protein TERG_01144 [Trichophyton rubrum CBS 118892]EZF10050.1 hypothetical protein H100_08610 [Trichophyton rubrum MR850]EZF36975.1 hypothetical protein H102_08569 [Trichophyton rubrum CBS 100081]EZF47591.1 hypothetical protein H103_08592 [Trichophyton rubrum CBS 288.86]EZF58267.1 hypothetical protein H104_08544 [Trichophyton rubrum CBS 289.86]EZF68813.1 hypothetical protein H105_08597 [Trichophyton soudanense CBS 452.61]EZF79488.1 hypothetical protein H110_08593 [Trichophy